MVEIIRFDETKCIKEIASLMSKAIMLLLKEITAPPNLKIKSWDSEVIPFGDCVVCIRIDGKVENGKIFTGKDSICVKLGEDPYREGASWLDENENDDLWNKKFRIASDFQAVSSDKSFVATPLHSILDQIRPIKDIMKDFEVVIQVDRVYNDSGCRQM